MNNQQQLEAIKGCAVGNQSSQRALFMEYSQELLATCKRYIGNEDEAKDILQDSFMRIFKYANTYSHDGGNLKGWMKTICIREALKKIEKNKRTTSMDELEYIPSVNPIAIQNLDVEELYNIIGKLPKRHRSVFNLYVVEGYSHREIGEMLNVDETCSRSILSRTKRLLKRKLMDVNLGFGYGNACYAY